MCVTMNASKAYKKDIEGKIVKINNTSKHLPKDARSCLTDNAISKMYCKEITKYEWCKEPLQRHFIHAVF